MRLPWYFHFPPEENDRWGPIPPAVKLEPQPADQRAGEPRKANKGAAA